MVSFEDKQLLAQIIVANLQEEFILKHLSGNLLDSIKIEDDEASGNVRIIIDAPTYDMLVYLKDKVIVHNGNGSYASALDEKGGQIFNKKTGNHKGYVDEVIMKSIRTWKDLVQKGVSLKQYGNTEYGTGSEI